MQQQENKKPSTWLDSNPRTLDQKISALPQCFNPCLNLWNLLLPALSTLLNWLVSRKWDLEGLFGLRWAKMKTSFQFMTKWKTGREYYVSNVWITKLDPSRVEAKNDVSEKMDSTWFRVCGKELFSSVFVPQSMKSLGGCVAFLLPTQEPQVWIPTQPRFFLFTA